MAHRGHNLEVHVSDTRIFDVINVSDTPPALVDVAYRERRTAQDATVYCRDCDLYLTGEWVAGHGVRAS